MTSDIKRRAVDEAERQFKDFHLKDGCTSIRILKEDHELPTEPCFIELGTLGSP